MVFYDLKGVMGVVEWGAVFCAMGRWWVELELESRWRCVGMLVWELRGVVEDEFRA